MGGKIYRARQSLLLKCPTKMLGTTASEIELRNTNDPIFIDRNGERFQYAIDNMLEGKVELPITISI